MLVIGNGRLVTRDPEQPFFENGAVAMDGTAIKKVGTLEEIKKEFPDAEYVDAKGGRHHAGLHQHPRAHLQCHGKRSFY